MNNMRSRLYLGSGRGCTVSIHVRSGRRIRAGEFPNADSLSKELDISERVVFRDRKKLIEMGVAKETT